MVITHWLNQRRLTLTALVITIITWVAFWQQWQTDLALLQRYHADPIAILNGYTAGSGLLLLAFIFEPFLRKHLSGGPVQWFWLFGCGAFAFVALVPMLFPQEMRLLGYPISLWWVILNVVAVCGLCAALAIHPLALARGLERGSLVIAIAFLLLLIGVYVGSLGEFMTIDLPDEPWWGRSSIQLVETGSFTSDYIGKIYGNPDPTIPRYFLAAAFWYQLSGYETLAQMRSFSLLVTALAVLPLAGALWKTPGLPNGARIAALALFLSMSVIVRMSHNLRPDIGGALYSALLLLGLVTLWHGTSRHWLLPFWIGLALLVGLETIPPVALGYGFSVGLVLVLWALRQPERQNALRIPMAYAVGSGLACLISFALRFLPDLAGQWNSYSLLVRMYQARGEFSGIRFDPQVLFDILISFSRSFSPVEWVALMVVMLAALFASARQRWILGAFLLAMLVTHIFYGMAYGYFTFTAPAAAYAAALVMRNRRALVVCVFVFVPAMAAPALSDMTDAMIKRPNTTLLQPTFELQSEIPRAVTLIGEPVYWLALNRDRSFIGWTALELYSRIHYQATTADMVEHFDPDLVLCWEEYPERCNAFAETGLFESARAIPYGDGETAIVLARIREAAAGG